MKSERVSPLGEVKGRISKADALVSLFEKRANSRAGSDSELEEVKHELKAIKGQVLSELLAARSLLQRMEKDLGG